MKKNGGEPFNHPGRMIDVHFGQHASVPRLTFKTVFTKYFDGRLVAFSGRHREGT
jgi:hypothetical protein